MNYLKQRIYATYQHLNLTELDTVERNLTVKNIKALNHDEIVKLSRLLETAKNPQWTIVNRHVDGMLEKINKYGKVLSK